METSDSLPIITLQCFRRSRLHAHGLYKYELRTEVANQDGSPWKFVKIYDTIVSWRDNWDTRRSIRIRWYTARVLKLSFVLCTLHGWKKGKMASACFFNTPYSVTHDYNAGAFQSDQRAWGPFVDNSIASAAMHLVRLYRKLNAQHQKFKQDSSMKPIPGKLDMYASDPQLTLLSYPLLDTPSTHSTCLQWPYHTKNSALE